MPKREQKFTAVLVEVNAALGVIAMRNKICIRTAKARSNQTMKGRFLTHDSEFTEVAVPARSHLFKAAGWVLRFFILSTILLSGNSHESQ